MQEDTNEEEENLDEIFFICPWCGIGITDDPEELCDSCEWYGRTYR